MQKVCYYLRAVVVSAATATTGGIRTPSLLVRITVTSCTHRIVHLIGGEEYLCGPLAINPLMEVAIVTSSMVIKAILILLLLLLLFNDD